MSWLDEVMRIMPSHAGAGDTVDWDVIEASWGTRFPDDYKEFTAEYGGGAVDDYLELLTPEIYVSPGGESSYSGMQQESANAEDVWRTSRPEVAEVPRLITWGIDSSADILCWLATDSDPNKWPVLVWGRGDAQWTQYSCGMLEFLCRLFRAEFDECPLSDLSLWGTASPRFLHWAEEQRLRKAGIDPWTGESDPFAGMFGD
ncbi:SMI1/KNR4 family protein [Streptomyces longwoodensis]|uniref:SMI1/KNR4 family protein n=1 Tax=Streptomyces longwoodensis TaxID=68231 RepID=UPI002E80FBDE|nr:SMI1/KNR4 family protein [Streptomyces longwoodensis]WUC55712.1 SMI1/KNR4 family protein [Streptomyces longwoodensis]WUC62168.1 SMI1/KNR4 family protein [Streptomyces longwoodensis]